METLQNEAWLLLTLQEYFIAPFPIQAYRGRGQRPLQILNQV